MSKNSKYKFDLKSFLKGINSFAAILPSFYTSYPYQQVGKSLSIDWQNIGQDLEQAVNKYRKERK